MFNHAQEAELRWPPKPGSWHWLRLLDATEDGPAKLFHTIIVRHRPGFTEDDARVLAKEIQSGTFARDQVIRDHPKATLAEVAVMIEDICKDQMSEVVRLATFGDQPIPKDQGAGETEKTETMTRPSETADPPGSPSTKSTIAQSGVAS